MDCGTWIEIPYVIALEAGAGADVEYSAGEVLGNCC